MEYFVGQKLTHTPSGDHISVVAVDDRIPPRWIEVVNKRTLEDYSILAENFSDYAPRGLTVRITESF